jgi:HK97 family phage prohead protease
MADAKIHQTKDFAITIKSVSDEGTFTGVLSVYDVVDLGNDSISKGAFSKTLQESGGDIPCLWQHRDPVGMLAVKDTGEALEVQGTLVMDLQLARDAVALMKAGVVHGLSIGYKVIKSKVENGVRILKEIALYEGSIVTFPMLPQAQVTGVKGEGKADFATELDMAQSLSARCMVQHALQNSLDSIVWDSRMDDVEKITASSESIDQFRGAYLSALPRYLDAMNNMSEMSAQPAEQKAGRTLSDASREKIQEAIDVLTALLAGTPTDTAPMVDEPMMAEAAGAQTAEAEKQGNTDSPAEADPDHSVLKTLLKQRRK